MDLSADYIKAHTGLCDVTVLESIDSTNSYLKGCAREKKEGTVVIAKSQTSGRGRLGRTFVSPQNGLYMSLLLKPEICANEIVKITTVAAVAVAMTIERFSDKKPLIKWVNDIYISDKKVCGILTESSFTIRNKPDWCVLGIGINMFEPSDGFDESIKNIASSVFDKENVSVNEFVVFLLNKLFELFNKKDCADEYRKRSYLDGKTVKYKQNGAECTGEVKGIDDSYGLIVENQGERNVLRFGEADLINFHK